MLLEKIPTLLNIPTTIVDAHSPIFRYSDNSLFVFRNNWNYKYIICSKPYANVYVDATVYTPVSFKIGDYTPFVNEANSSFSKSLVIADAAPETYYVFGDKFLGAIYTEIYNSETEEYSGDAFYTSENSNFVIDTPKTFIPRGSITSSGEAFQATLTKPIHWELVEETKIVSENEAMDAITGVYNPSSGAEGSKTIGLPAYQATYVGESTALFSCVRALNPISGTIYNYNSYGSSSFTYSSINYNSDLTKWVIGEVNSDTGWWVGNQPNKESEVIFDFTVKEGSTVTGNNIKVKYANYVYGNNERVIYLGDTAIWR